MIGLDWTGIEVECLREAMLRSVDEFAAEVECAPRTIRLWESKGTQARLNPSSKRLLEDRYRVLDDAQRQRFEAALARAGRLPDGSAPPGSAAQPGSAVVPGTDLLSTLDRIRTVVDETLSKCTVTPARIDLIAERVADMAQVYTMTPPTSVLAETAPLLLEIQKIAGERQPPFVQGRLCEITAVLALLTADALMKLGEIGRANYWYGTACVAADDSASDQLRATARAQYAMLPYYYGDLRKAISLARTAQEQLPGVTCDAVALAAAAEARALARLGDSSGAEDAMNRARRLTEALPDYDGSEAFRFSGQRLLLYMSGTLTYMGRTHQAARIQDQALLLYRQLTVVIDPALIRLDAALGYARTGAVSDCCQLAQDVLIALPREHRTRIIATRALDVLAALPGECRHDASAESLRELIATEVVAQ